MHEEIWGDELVLFLTILISAVLLFANDTGYSIDDARKDNAKLANENMAPSFMLESALKASTAAFTNSCKIFDSDSNKTCNTEPVKYDLYCLPKVEGDTVAASGGKCTKPVVKDGREVAGPPVADKGEDGKSKSITSPPPKTAEKSKASSSAPKTPARSESEHGLSCSGFIAAVFKAAGCDIYKKKGGGSKGLDIFETTQLIKDVKAQPNKTCLAPAKGGFMAGDLLIYGDHGGKEGHVVMLGSAPAGEKEIECDDGGAPSLAKSGMIISHSSSTGKGVNHQKASDYAKTGSAFHARGLNDAVNSICKKGAITPGGDEGQQAAVLRFQPGPGCECKKENAAKPKGWGSCKCGGDTDEINEALYN